MRTLIVQGVLLTAAVLPAPGQAQQQAPSTPEQQIQALQQQLKNLQKQREIEALQKQLDAQKRQLEQQKQAQPECVPAPPQKPCGFLCREMKSMQEKAKAAAQEQIDKAGDKAAQKTKGKMNRTDLPGINDMTGQTPKANACPAGTVPANTVQKGGNS